MAASARSSATAVVASDSVDEGDGWVREVDGVDLR
jgi:hypothetical protein